MKDFKDMGIEIPMPEHFKGKKINISEILNTPVIIHDFKEEPSKYEGQRLALQIEFNNELRVVWFKAIIITLLLYKIPKEDFPFKATIIRPNNMHYQFKK